MLLAGLGMDAIMRAPRPAPRRLSIAARAAFIALVALTFASLATDYATMARGLQVSGAVQYLFFLALLTACATLVLVGIRRGGTGWALGLAAVQLASLAPLAATYNPVIDTRFLYPTPPALASLKERAPRRPGGYSCPRTSPCSTGSTAWPDTTA